MSSSPIVIAHEPAADRPATDRPPDSSRVPVVICAGETSGDRLAAGLVRAAFKSRQDLCFTGMGGPRMREVGVTTLIDVKDLAVVGIWEALRQYPRLRRLLHKMQAHLQLLRPRLLILVDYVEFNLRLAAFAKRLGIPVLFYVSPQIWAWRPQRIHRIKRSIDAMAVLFPFETAIYEQHAVPVRYVGNPVLDTASLPTRDLPTAVPLPSASRRIGLLPGSRNGEIARHWPLLVDAATRLHAADPTLQFLVPLAPGITREQLRARADWSGLPIIVLDEPFTARDVMACSDLLLICSGTATLEAALLQTPMLVLYRTSWLTYALGTRLVSLQHIALANIVAGRGIVPEYLQDRATPTIIADAALQLLQDPEALARMRAELGEVRARMGPPGADQRVAAMALEMLARPTAG